MARLYADEDFDLGVVEALRGLGHDVLTVLEAGQANQAIPDDAILQYAGSHGRAVITFNRRHFIRLHRTGIAHAGILGCTRDPDARALAARIHAALAEHQSLVGELLRINRPQTSTQGSV